MGGEWWAHGQGGRGRVGGAGIMAASAQGPPKRNP